MFTRFAFVRVSVFVALVVSSAFVVTVNAPVKFIGAPRLVALAKVVSAASAASFESVIPPFAVIVPARVRPPSVGGKARAPVTVKLSPDVFPSETVSAVVNVAVAALVAESPAPLLKKTFPPFTASAFVTASAALAVKVPLPLIVRSLETFAASFTVSDPPPL